ncbi:DhaKLM operon coactivator DhaQ [Vagococcus coleopterorum]|uniref:DhaKLM operon coactivator DhaQ n=1 Tax=Vagococcus coleopterorum TaxID=2714946 RepID=A0A6G8AME8_9ENTE|nr:DhaKLM operon coactivator DhaQ [Vagococcus coleopterorum]QIL46176.1 DhaKLM operon coactivator DhaQ [Vagococcus coleopterorum]
MNKKIMNRPEDTVSQVLNGIIFANDDRLERLPKTGIIIKKERQTNQVAVISGGGTGHEPAHSGYVGENMLAASINGGIFTPPEPAEILQAIEAADQGQGVLLIVKNFERDVENFLAAETLAKEKGHQVSHVIVNDDCSIDKENFKKRRRGVAGTIFVHKILGAAATEGQSLEALATLGEEVVASINTLGVALAPGVIPGTNDSQFKLADDQISFGIGIHGEAGYREEPLHSSEQLANELINKLKTHYQWRKDMKVAVMVNGLGSTPLMELQIFANDVRRLLMLEEVEVAYKKVGTFMSSIDMAGVSLSILEIKDDQWLAYLNKPTDSYGW